MRATPAAAVAIALALLMSARPLTARDSPDQCPGTFEEKAKVHPACPPAEALAWIDCPKHFPLDPSKKLKYGPLHFERYYTWPDIERLHLDNHPEGGQLYCMYGKTNLETDLYRLILEVPGPIVQWGWHKTADGYTFGCRVPKELAATPRVMQVVPPIDHNLALEGFRLGMSETDIRGLAAEKGYEIDTTEPRRLTLRKADIHLDIILHPKTGKTREIVQPLGDRPRLDLQRELAYRFGMGWEMWDLRPNDPKYLNWNKKVWPSRDETMAVEWHPKTPFGDPATLHLVDRRK
ncbi:MAG: hypothetical protein HQL42_07775 [Alphaproteobacteria bacterium]|nr:hypothetical protein [Alphaproteobacteria bacterium]